jgi:hypothetical protein
MGVGKRRRRADPAIQPGRCPVHKKRTITSWRVADRVAHRLPDQGRPYWCKAMGGYHITREDQSEYDRCRAEFLGQDGPPDVA